MIASLRPIHDADSHQAALEEIERLWGVAPSSPEGARLDLLMTLVDAYERVQWEDDALDPIDAIKARMENSGRTRKDLEKIVGSSGRVSEILTRKRRLTLPMIWLLVERWKMPASVLVRPYKLAKKRAVKKRARHAA
jgi:HTH-type transcriptional regulator/antitoxin HigA